MVGRVHSIQSLGAVDGPGIRYVAFMQGCPIRCMYCHNPETWDINSQDCMEMEPEELAAKALRCKPYYEKEGGVTVTGGEPLMQPDFVAEYFRIMQQNGVHTALDTSGAVGLTGAKKVLPYTNLVLADLKFLDAKDYKQYCRADFNKVEAFLKLTEEMEIPLWVRHVVVPGYTDSIDFMKRLGEKAHSYKNLERIELLPFRNLCLEKYESMGIEFPLKDVPQMEVKRCEELKQYLA